MADRNAALCERARLHGVELSPEQAARLQSARAAADAAEAIAQAAEPEAKRLREIARLAAVAAKLAAEQVKPLREAAKAAREEATILHKAMLNVTIKARQHERDLRELAECEARLAALRARVAA